LRGYAAAMHRELQQHRCMRRSVGGRCLGLGRNLQADAITDVARQWKRPFMVFSLIVPIENASAQIQGF